jgi:hypothetical protein
MCKRSMCKASASSGPRASNYVNSFLNFLQYPAIVISNLKVENSIAKFKLPVGRFSSVFLVVIDN